MLRLNQKAQSSKDTVKSYFIILNEKGLHTRPSTEIVKCASSFQADIFLSLGEMTVNAKSILGILMLAATKGTRLDISATGEDAEQAVEALKKLAAQNFYIHY